MTVETILAGRAPTIYSVTADTMVGDVVAVLNEHRIGAVPVMDNGSVVGIFSERDVVHCIKDHGINALERPVRDVMTSPVISVTKDMSVLAALSLMTRRRIRHLPVIDGERLVGFVSIGDLVKFRIERIEEEADAMRNYIQGVT